MANPMDLLKKQMIKQFLPEAIENIGAVDDFVCEYLRKIELTDWETYASFMFVPTKDGKLIIYTVTMTADDKVSRQIAKHTTAEFLQTILKSANL